MWYLAETRKVGAMPRLECLYEGPYLINEKNTDINSVFLLDQDGKQKGVYHEGDNIPTWLRKARRKVFQ